MQNGNIKFFCVRHRSYLEVLGEKQEDTSDYIRQEYKEYAGRKGTGRRKIV